MKKATFFLIPLLVITALYFMTRFIMDAIIEIEDDQWGEDGQS
jgi:uncharacterized membrane protein YhdT